MVFPATSNPHARQGVSLFSHGQKPGFEGLFILAAKPPPLHFPPALYLTLVTKGHFHKEPKKYISQMKEFMEKLHLKDKKVIFITPFRNTSDENVKESFYVKFELQVEYE